ncbi:MAG: Nif3-like dinuclear metal center hexameric protein [bacterium]|nr:Nif3-like dinuclear metal center hexameric protein [bacterium]
MQLSEFHRVVDFVLPPSTAMPGDNIGMHIDSRRGTANNVLVCLELTDAVLTEADALDCDVILTFHPLIYEPLTRIDRSRRVGGLVCGLIERDIALLCVHTSFDVFPQGTNYLLALHLGLTPLGTLDASGMGLIASADAVPFASFIRQLGEVCGGPVRYVAPTNEVVSLVAIVGGSGMSFFDRAVQSGVDVFVTADVKYHAFLAAHGVVGLADPGHYEMEQFVPEGLVQAIRPHLLGDTILRTTSVVTNPGRWSVPDRIHSQAISFT